MKQLEQLGVNILFSDSGFLSKKNILTYYDNFLQQLTVTSSPIHLSNYMCYFNSLSMLLLSRSHDSDCPFYIFNFNSL